MTTFRERIRRVIRHQASVCVRRLRRETVSPFPLGSGTLDQDDVEIAWQWLKNAPEEGADPATVERFEEVFSRWNGSAAAFAFASGRESLSAILHAMGLGTDDEVIVPGYTCVVVPNALRFAGVKPVFADIELQTYGLDVTRLGPLITPRTRAIVIQHLYGLVCRDYLATLEFARERGLKVIEDCAQATGAALDGVRVGCRGDAAFYSLEQSKVMSSFQGGLAVAHDADLARGIAAYRSRLPVLGPERTRTALENIVLNYHASKDPQRWWRGDWMYLRMGGSVVDTTTRGEVEGEQPEGYGARMPAALAAVGLNQLRKIDFYNARRRDNAARWDRWCDENGFERAHVIPGSTPVFLRYPVMATSALKRDRIWARRDLGVELGVWFVSQEHPSPRPVPGCPNGEEAVDRCINFPTLFGDRHPTE